MSEEVSKRRYAVVGLGRLGTALAQALVQAGVPVSALVSRRPQEMRDFAAGLAVPLVSLAEVARSAEVVLLTVPDGELGAMAGQIPLFERHWLVHCSGALSPSVLRVDTHPEVQVAGFHPLQAFPPGSGPERFRGIRIGIEAEAELYDALAALACRLGATPLSLKGVDRARYHGAAVFASNYLVALMQAATSAWTRAGLPADDALSGLLPLTRGALQALEGLGGQPLAAALTGPVARGDVATVERHLEALAEDPELQRVYGALGRLLLRLGLPLPPEVHGALLQRLPGGGVDVDG